MSKHLYIILCILAAWGCRGEAQRPGPEPDKEPDKEAENEPELVQEVPAFAKGADISWASEMEAGDVKFRKKDGSEASLLEVLKDCGVNAIRLRVWVNPYGGWSGPEDVLKAAKNVREAGLALMVDFHYSDFFADPGRQQIPAEWVADKTDLDKLCQHVGRHTTDVLQSLKDAGVSVAWVQIGNETRNGMLWPAGQMWTVEGDIPDGRAHFARLYNAGYDAAKAVFPEALVMPHLNNAWEDNDWWFRQVKAAGGKFDAIALSHYPQAEDKFTAAEYNQKAIGQIKQLHATYQIPIIVSEVGVKPARADAADVLKAFLQAARAIDGCQGVFYWEPEVYGDWVPAVYKDADAIFQYTGTRETWGAYDQGAFTAEGMPSAILDCFQ